MKPERIIMGVDPGTQLLGWGVIAIDGNTPRYVAMGSLSVKRERDHFARIGLVFKEMVALIDRYMPDEFAIEAPFYGKNVQSMLKLGRAQGALISAAQSRSLPVFEYAPRRVKLSITGRGGASKEQVASILTKILSVTDYFSSLDATDALAVALCHYLNTNLLSYSPKSTKSGPGPTLNSWDRFIKEHPDRVK